MQIVYHHGTGSWYAPLDKTDEGLSGAGKPEGTTHTFWDEDHDDHDLMSGMGITGRHGPYSRA